MAIPQGAVQPHKTEQDAKKRLAVIAGGGLLAVFVLVRGLGGSSSSAASPDQIAAAQQAQQAADQALYGQTGATGVADNGGSAAQLDSDITSALGGVQTALEGFTQSQQTTGDIPATSTTDDTGKTADPNIAAVAAGIAAALAANGSGQHSNQAAAPSTNGAGGASGNPSGGSSGGAGGGAVIQSGSWASTSVGTIATHAGGPFYDWYKSIFGKAPPAAVASNNRVYQAWKTGQPKAAVKKLGPIK